MRLTPQELIAFCDLWPMLEVRARAARELMVREIVRHKRKRTTNPRRKKRAK